MARITPASVPQGEVAGGPAEVAAGGGGGVDDVARIGLAVAVGVGAPLAPGGGDELHRADRVVPAGVAVERAAVGVTADRDADDGHEAVAEDVQPAHAVVGLGLADGGQQLPAQPAGRLLGRQGGLGLAVRVVGHGGHAVDGGLPELADDAVEPGGHLGALRGRGVQLLGSSGAGGRRAATTSLSAWARRSATAARALATCWAWSRAAALETSSVARPHTASSAGLLRADRKARRSRESAEPYM